MYRNLKEAETQTSKVRTGHSTELLTVMENLPHREEIKSLPHTIYKGWSLIDKRHKYEENHKTLRRKYQITPL